MIRRARLGVAALAVAAVYAALVPLAPGAAAVGPDWLYCLVIAVVARRPDAMPVWLVLAAGMLADLMLARPPGLGALGLVLASEALRGRRGWSFPLEWAAAVAVFAAMLGGMSLALALSLAPMPDWTGLGWHVLATGLAYPLVVALVVRGLGLSARRERA